MGAAKMRLFIAIELPPDVRAHLHRVQDAMRPEVPPIWWTREENLHITLKFIGDFPEQLLKRLIDDLSTARATGEMVAHAEAIECFPGRGDIRIFSAGISGNILALWSLQDTIEALCAEHGVTREQRHYVPHVTLARAKEKVPSIVRPRVERLTSSLWPGPEFVISHFTLARSELSQAGARYTALAKIPAL